MAMIMELALKTNQEAPAKFLVGQNREVRRIARGRQDMKRMAAQLRQPDQSVFASGAEAQQKEYGARTKKRERGTSLQRVLPTRKGRQWQRVQAARASFPPGLANPAFLLRNMAIISKPGPSRLRHPRTVFQEAGNSIFGASFAPMSAVFQK